MGSNLQTIFTRIKGDYKGKGLKEIIVKTPTPTQHNTTVGFDTKMTVQTPPTHHHTNFSGTSRRARELKFGTDTH